MHAYIHNKLYTFRATPNFSREFKYNENPNPIRATSFKHKFLEVGYANTVALLSPEPPLLGPPGMPI